MEIVYHIYFNDKDYRLLEYSDDVPRIGDFIYIGRDRIIRSLSDVRKFVVRSVTRFPVFSDNGVKQREPSFEIEIGLA